MMENNANTNDSPIISLKGVSKWYEDFQALKNIDLEIKLKEKIVNLWSIRFRKIYLN